MSANTQTKKHVWFNLNTGEFSNSWDPNSAVLSSSIYSEDSLKNANEQGWKMIEYTCINDENFDFYERMKVVTNPKKKK